MGKADKWDADNSNQKSGLRGVDDAYGVLLKKLKETALQLEWEQSRRVKEQGAFKESHIDSRLLIEEMEREKDEFNQLRLYFKKLEVILEDWS